MPAWDILLRNVHLATMTEGGAPYGAIADGALAVEDGRIAWLGAAADLPHQEAASVIDGAGGWLTPGLIDCHTHLVFGGDRAGEFEQRLAGVSYEEIARAGGGIASTVAATRAASAAELTAAAQARLAALRAEGVTTVEIKSGYGLDRETEIRMLEVARALGETPGIEVRTSYLGAHALPREYASDRASYLELVCERVLPEVAARGLADAVDAFCEDIAFAPEEVARVFAGDRAGEFEQRLLGASYEEIARAGGGIASTVAATRKASAAELEASARRRLDALRADGVTTIEIKSGYGLDHVTEIRTLAVARTLGETPGIEVRTSYLGAHALPREYADDRAGYLDLVCERVLPEVGAAGLADAVDAFCEGIAFTPDEVARVFAAARHQGLPVKLHADQLSDLGGAALAARFDALSADHLEYTSEAGVAAMAAAGTVAVLLPGAFYTLHETRLPPIDAFRRHGVPIALASDCNPGSSPLTSLLAALY
ncbi:MAG TPA: imidazolonepropionase, partial [Geminicoccaceae bacterium]|nr:imidazolonepropionase [Geminicoccaceae bacterium]